MRPRALLILLLLVLLPGAALLIMGARLTARETQSLSVEHDERQKGELHMLASFAQPAFDRTAMRLLGVLTQIPLNAEAARRSVQELGVLQQLVVLDAKHQLIHPDPSAIDLSEQESALLESLRAYRVQRRVTLPVPEKNHTTGFWSIVPAEGRPLIFFSIERPDGFIYAQIALTRLVAVILADLQDRADSLPTFAHTQLHLLGPNGDLIAVLRGSTDPQGREIAEAFLPSPLNLYRLRLSLLPGSMPAALAGTALRFNLISAAILIVLSMFIAAIFLVREQRRAFAEAAQRVSFVNQVSHELRTPLTNIRMYAELVQEGLHDDDSELKKNVSVIVDEAQRLGRIIGNVLAFGRAERGTLNLVRSSGRIEETVQRALSSFAPFFEQRGIAARLRIHDSKTRSYDRDALEQILVNLLSNVEKYAAGGKEVIITAQDQGDMLVMTVEDRGPGIPRKEQRRLFRPFSRGSDRITEGVSGSGLGLAISRDLARLHGGDLVLLRGEQGACFQLTINAPEVVGS